MEDIELPIFPAVTLIAFNNKNVEKVGGASKILSWQFFSSLNHLDTRGAPGERFDWPTK